MSASSDIVVAAIGPAIGGLIAGVVGLAASLLMERHRRRADDSRKHMEDLRQGVLLPLISRIESYCLPIARGEKPPVELGRKQVAAPVLDQDTSSSQWVEQFVPLQPTSTLKAGTSVGLRPWRVRAEPPVRINRTLYEHAKGAHHTALFRDCEQAEAGLAALQKDCISWVEGVLTGLSAQLLIPIRDANDSYGSKGGGLLRYLGIFVLERHLGISVSSLIYTSRSGPGREAELLCDTRTYAFGSTQQMEECRKAIDTLLTDPAPGASLRRTMEGLQQEFERLLSGLQRIEAQPRVRERCSYVHG